MIYRCSGCGGLITFAYPNYFTQCQCGAIYKLSFTTSTTTNALGWQGFPAPIQEQQALNLLQQYMEAYPPRQPKTPVPEAFQDAFKEGELEL